MATVRISEDNLNETLTTNDIVFLDFWAEWCMPCKRFAPVYEEASEKYPDIVFGKVNTEEEQDLSSAAGISSIPTIMIFRDQIPVFTQAGALPLSALDSLVEQVRGLDMDDVRQKLAEQEQSDPDDTHAHYN